MKNKAYPAAASATLTFLLSATAAAQLAVVDQRCVEDSLSAAQARQRLDWWLTNHFGMAKRRAEAILGQTIATADVGAFWTANALVDFLGRPRLRPNYPTFGTMPGFLNPNGFRAFPISNANLPDNYTVLGMCTASCYKPDGLVTFSSVDGEGAVSYGDVPIGEAFEEQRESLAVLTEDSTLEAPELRSMSVGSYTRSATPAQHDIFVLTTEEGHVLEVTGNHPVVDATGAMREADTFAVGEALVRSDGSLEAISSIEVEPFFGRVFNVRPSSFERLNNVVVANGFLNGSSNYQNDLHDQLNLKLFRTHLPDELLK